MKRLKPNLCTPVRDGFVEIVPYRIFIFFITVFCFDTQLAILEMGKLQIMVLSRQNSELLIIAIICMYLLTPVKSSHRGDNMQSNKTCPILEQYLAYLITIKGRSQNTILEHRMDLLPFFRYVAVQRGIPVPCFQFADADFIHSIQLTDMYGFIAYHQEILHNSPGTRCRKIVSIRQFWKYLKFKAHIIDNNIAEELETPKLPKRIVRCMTLEESVRLLIESNSSSVRDNCQRQPLRHDVQLNIMAI